MKPNSPGLPDSAVLYRALRARDKRFDGRVYAGVRTTGIYCRPVCPARPLEKNVRFYRSAAEAENAGYRPCLRCRPDLSPSAPLFHGTAAVVGRALRLIAAGDADAQSFPELAGRLGLTDRHLRRLFAEHVGASPMEVATSRRLHLARQLLTQTSLPVTQIAFAAGFRSLRRFNQAFADRYRRAPREFRRAPARPGEGAALNLELPVLVPYDWAGLLGFLARHSVPGLERVSAGGYERSLEGGGRLRVTYRKGALLVALQGCPVEKMRDVIERVRHLFDVDHNPAMLPAELRGLRVPGAFDGFETAVTVILGQRVSVAAASRAGARLLAAHGEPVQNPEAGLTHEFPAAARLARADLSNLGVPLARAKAVRALARAVSEEGLDLSRAAALLATRARLAKIAGIGPWTVELIAMRCLADPDAFPANDLAVARALQSPSRSRPPTRARGPSLKPETYRPWRSYLTLRLWRAHRASQQKEKK